MELNQLQNWMQHALLYPGKVEGSAIDRSLLPTGNLTAAQSLGIYQRSYYTRLLACLREQYPALCYCLGESVFNAFAQEYLFEYPSTSYTLHDLGKYFPQYLESTRPDKAEPESTKELWIEFMVQLAGFERLAYIMFDAEGDEGCLAQWSGRADGDNYKVQRCVRLYAAQFPVADYYCKVRDNIEPQLPPLMASKIALVRVDFRTRIIPLGDPEYALLEAFIHCSDIQQAIRRAAQGSEEQWTEHQLLEYWQQKGGFRDHWLQKGFLVHTNAVNP